MNSNDVNDIRSLFDKATTDCHLPKIEYDQLVLVGAGQLGRFVAQSLKENTSSIAAFADDTSHLQGTAILDIPVMSVQEAIAVYNTTATFVVCIMNEHHQYLQTRQRLLAMNASNIISFQQLAYQYSDLLLPWYQFNNPAVLISQQAQWEQVYGMLDDDISKDHLLCLLKNRLFCDFESLPVNQVAYFPEGIFDRKKIQHYVDCGAFDGDTIEAFLQIGSEIKSITAFEPDKTNYQALLSRVSGYKATTRDKIKLCHSAVSNRIGKATFSADAGAASMLSSDGDQQVDVTTLDNFITDSPVDYIKFDVEGAEQEALAGGYKTIQKHHPILAISSYHLPNDIIDIPFWLHQHFPNYRIAFRLEGTDGLGGVIYAYLPTI